MEKTTFPIFFHVSTGNQPYDYQKRLACGDQNERQEAEWLAGGGADCKSQLINIPTGLGKTAAVVMAWLWNRVILKSEKWPRRLVYCLPMRTLVEQTQSEVQKWLKNLLEKAEELQLSPDAKEQLEWLNKNSPIILMGGEERDRNWDIWPEKPAILIGTQDMLLSRALNRGYGMSRYRWPMHFGLLNNDCLWVMDETQLMGVGVETSAQLDGFRHSEKMPTLGVCSTWWMSATLEETRLQTVDHQDPAHTERLSDAEQATGRPHELITAFKKLSPAPITLNSGTKDYAKQLAELVKDCHQLGTLTLVIVNRVKRAREIYQALTVAEKKSKQPIYDAAKVALIHSRFRPEDRALHEELLLGSGDRIVIATQAVEAGVDVSARLLITELAPWSSLVQRMGRCNRRAEISDAEVLWVDIKPKDEKDDLLLPYSEAELSEARNALGKLTNASPKALREIEIQERPIIRPVIRHRDLLDLFDTTPDICGQDLDISRYIHDGEDSDVQFFWRDVDDKPGEKEPQPEQDELCRVSIGDAVKFFGKEKTEAWQWNPLEREWQKASRPRAGRVYLLAISSGGYSDDLGWTGNPGDLPTPHRPDTTAPEGYDDEPDTFDHFWQTLAEHTQFVVEQTVALATLAGEAKLAEALRTAALWHDIGKAHEEFQGMLRHGDATKEGTLWAKSENKNGRCSRHGFRHELASALAWLLADTPQAPGNPGSRERDLIAYLIAAHHGKVRLSIRSLPDEKGNPDAPDKLFARGIWEVDKVPPINLGEMKTPETVLDLSLMQMGEGSHGASWLARTVALRDCLGPFRLACLETLLRAADARASCKTTD